MVTCAVAAHIRACCALSSGRPAMPDLPGALQRNAALDLWIRIEPRTKSTIRTGKVEIGQGILTALALIAAEELDVDPARIDIASAVTGQSPNEFITAGAMSVEDSGSAIRQACGDARRIMVMRACAELGAPVDAIDVVAGVMGVPVPNKTLSYWDVQGGRPFGVRLEEWIPEKAVERYLLRN